MVRGAIGRAWSSAATFLQGGARVQQPRGDRAVAEQGATRDSGAGKLSRTPEANVEFRVLNEGADPVLALVFMRNGEPVPPNGRVFTLELSPETTKLEADTLASLLNRRV